MNRRSLHAASNGAGTEQIPPTSSKSRIKRSTSRSLQIPPGALGFENGETLSPVLTVVESHDFDKSLVLE